LISNAKELDDVFQESAESGEALNESLSNLNFSHVVTGAEALTSFAGLLGNTVTAINAVKSAINTFKNDEATFGEKLTAGFLALSMLLPTVTSAFTNLSKVLSFIDPVMSAIAAKNAIVSGSYIYIGEAATKAGFLSAKSYLESLANAEKLTATKAAEIVITKGLISEEQKAILIKKLENAEKEKERALSAAEVLEIIGISAAKKTETSLRWANVVAKIAEKNATLGLIAAAAPYLAILTAVIAALGIIIKLSSDAANAVVNANKQISELSNDIIEEHKKVDELNKSLEETNN
jgi:hypothetical protein